MNRVVKVLVVYFLGFYKLGYSQEETKGKIKKIKAFFGEINQSFF